MSETIVPPARPILAYSRISGEPLALVQSATVENKWHVTSESSCDCRSFTYRSRCRHIGPAPRRPAGQILVARLSA